MAILNIFADASSAMTVISLITFLGILWWTFGVKRSADFDAAARLPFADETDGAGTTRQESQRGSLGDLQRDSRLDSQHDLQRDQQRVSQDSEKHHG
jgi:cytochrome c oxidase cbb3-type subunit 4